MKKQTYFIQRKHDEQGMAAILITMVVMIVITLIVLGFAAISRREQRQALDNQLQTQAFYAAESGINDAKKILSAAIAGGSDLSGLTKSSCADNAPYNTLHPDLDPSRGVSYSCVLVDPRPTELVYGSVSDNKSAVAQLSTDTAPTSISVTWSPADPSIYGSPIPLYTPANPQGCPFASGNDTYFKPSSGGNERKCKYPVLRVDLVDVSDLSADLNSKMTTFYFQPFSEGGAGDPALYKVSSTPNLASVSAPHVKCDSGSYKSCTATITAASSANPLTSKMAVRITSLYGKSSLVISAQGATGALSFKNGQIVIDATGKAQDVSRRIQVRVPVTQGAGDLTPNYGIQTGGSVCKRYTVYPGNFIIDPGINGAIGIGDPMCGN